MPERDFTLIASEGRSERTTRAPARVEGSRVRIAPDALERAFGWKLAPQGLCKGDVCVTPRERRGLVDDAGVELSAFAQTVGQPLALDVAEGVAVLGASAAARGSQLATLEAPDFTLPDLTGKQHSLASYRGKKVLLIAYASW
jgi:hypothetical protein